MTFLKKQGAGFHVSLAVCVLAVIAVILYGANASTAYYHDSNSVVITLSVIGILLTVISLVIGQAADKNDFLEKLLDLMRIAIPCLFIAAGVMFLGARVYSYGIIFFSDLESGNPAAMAAAKQSIAGVACYACSAILAAIAAFFAIKKSK